MGDQETGWIGWTVVLNRKDGTEFIASAPAAGPNICGCYYARTRDVARAHLRACKANGFTGRVAQVTVKATVYAE